MGYILVGSLTRLKTLVYKINGAEYIKVYIKHNGELNPGIIPMLLQNSVNSDWLFNTQSKVQLIANF